MIWRAPVPLEKLNAIRDTLASHLGIEFTAWDHDSLTARMPVDQRTEKQPAGILHGGASLALAETLGSVASKLVLDDRHTAVGLEINANHLRPVDSGFVIGVCRPLHLGRKTHVWDIRLSNQQGKPTCVSRFTVAVIPATIPNSAEMKDS